MSRVPRPNLYTYFLQTPVVEFGVNNLQVNTISISVTGGQGGQRQGNGGQEQGWPIANGCHLTHSPLSPPCRNRAVLPLALLNSVLQLPTHPISSVACSLCDTKDTLPPRLSEYAYGRHRMPVPCWDLYPLEL